MYPINPCTFSLSLKLVLNIIFRKVKVACVKVLVISYAFLKQIIWAQNHSPNMPHDILTGVFYCYLSSQTMSCVACFRSLLWHLVLLPQVVWILGLYLFICSYTQLDVWKQSGTAPWFLFSCLDF